MADRYDFTEYDFTEEEYQNLRSQLNSQELEEIERLEKDCADLSVDYWEFYRRTEKYKVGTRWTPKKLVRLVYSPMYELRMCLLYRAARLRGIITE